jgi:hypothetical protein
VIDRLTPYGTTSTSLVLGSVVEKSLLGPKHLDWTPPQKPDSQA